MDKYSLEVQKIMSQAETIAFSFGHSLVGSEHLLLAILKNDTLLTKELKNYKITYESLYKKIKNLYPCHDDEPLYMEYTIELKNLMENALTISLQYHENQVSTSSLFVSLTVFRFLTYIFVLEFLALFLHFNFTFKISSLPLLQFFVIINLLLLELYCKFSHEFKLEKLLLVISSKISLSY